MELSPFGDTLKTDFKQTDTQPALSNSETAEFNVQLMSAIEQLAANFVMQLSSANKNSSGSNPMPGEGSSSVDISSFMEEFSQNGIGADGKISDNGIKLLNDEFKQLIEQNNIGNPTQYQQLLKDFQDGLQKDLDLFKNVSLSGSLPKMFENLTKSDVNDEQLSKQLISDKLNQFLFNDKLDNNTNINSSVISNFIDDLPDDLQTLTNTLRKDKLSTKELVENILNIKSDNVNKSIVDGKFEGYKIEDLTKFSQDLKNLNLDEIKVTLESKPVFNVPRVQSLKLASFLSEQIESQMNLQNSEKIDDFAINSQDSNNDSSKLSSISKNDIFQLKGQSLNTVQLLVEQIDAMDTDQNDSKANPVRTIKVGEQFAYQNNSGSGKEIDLMNKDSRTSNSTEASDIKSFIQSQSSDDALNNKENNQFLNSKNSNFKNELAKTDNDNNTLSTKIDTTLNNNQQSGSIDKNQPLTKTEFIALLKNNSANNLNISFQDSESAKSMNYNNVLAREIPEVAMKLIQNIQQNESTTARLTLMPKSLGTLFVDIHLVDNKIRIDFKVDKKESVEAIENQIGLLKEKLTNSGITIDRIEVKQNSEYSNNFAGFNNQNGNEKKEQQQTMNDYLKTFKNTDDNESNIEIKNENKLSNSQGRLIEKYV